MLAIFRYSSPCFEKHEIPFSFLLYFSTPFVENCRCGFELIGIGIARRHLYLTFVKNSVSIGDAKCRVTSISRIFASHPLGGKESKDEQEAMPDAFHCRWKTASMLGGSGYGRIRPWRAKQSFATYTISILVSCEGHPTTFMFTGLIETALEKILVTMGRFSNMGYLQSVLEAQACCDNFSVCRDSMVSALENLLKSRNQVPPLTNSVPWTDTLCF